MTPCELLGLSSIGGRRGACGGDKIQAHNPATGEQLEPPFYCASPEEVDLAARLADEAFHEFGSASGERKAGLLENIARQLETAADPLIARCQLETGLPEARLRGELGRTTGQLRMFSTLCRDGWWVDARIDHGDPERKPAPKPDVRSMYRPLGPVAVFCASNFPFAFSVAGGDTASALAAGCPVVVLAHHAHPGTAEIVGGCVRRAVAETGFHAGVFSLLFGRGSVAGVRLVRHPAIHAVGFTGSRKGGMALTAEAAARPCPIPVYAEMSSINPVILLEQVLVERGGVIAQGLHTSFTLGVGQFCTNPGLILLTRSNVSEHFIQALARLTADTPPGVMLHAGIRAAYLASEESFAATGRIQIIATGAPSDACRVSARLMRCSGRDFLADSRLAEEQFGPATMLVECENEAEILEIIDRLEGQLTLTLHGTAAELSARRGWIPRLERKAGRLVINGFPTGVELGHAITHGGPFPSTSEGRSTSVGSRAIYRFVRPICYQDFPEELLPMELQETNASGVLRLVDGRPVVPCELIPKKV